MKKIFLCLLNLKIRDKLFISITSLMVLIIAASTQLTYNYYENLMEAKAKDSMRETLTIISSSIDRNVSELYTDIGRLIMSDAMQQITKDIDVGKSADFGYNYAALQEEIFSIINENRLVDSLFIYGKNGEFYSHSSVGLKHIDLTDSGWLSDDLYVSSDISWLDVRENSLIHSSKKVIPIIFPLGYDEDLRQVTIDFEEENVLGYVVLNIDENALNQYLEGMNKTEDARIYVTLASGVPLNVTEQNIYAQVVCSDTVKGQLYDAEQFFSELTCDVKGDSFIVMSHQTKFENLYISSAVSKDILFSDIAMIRVLMIFVLIVSVALTILVCLLMTYVITKPIGTLRQAIADVEANRYMDNVPVFYDDDIGKLGKSFNAMVTVIHEQMENIKKKEKMKTEAEIQVLTEQINPHFLYNTLESIQWQILGDEKESAASTVEKLGMLLRLSLNNGRETTTIKNEIIHVTSYLDIMNFRTKNRIALHVEVGDRLNDYVMIKILLQPIVENCIKHGFKQGLYECPVHTQSTINITIERIDDQLVLSVADNGVGFDCEKMENIMQQPVPTDRNGSFGLRNVITRLNLYYAEKVDIQFSSIPYYSNVVKISIPYVD